MENHEVVVESADTLVVELLSSALDDRCPACERLGHENAPLAFIFEVSKSPPGGLRNLAADEIAADLYELLLKKTPPKSENGALDEKSWEELRARLFGTMKRHERYKRGRYFIVFKNRTEYENNAKAVEMLKNKLKYLRFFILNNNESIETQLPDEDQFTPLGYIVYRHQTYAVQHQLSEPTSGPSNPEQRD